MHESACTQYDGWVWLIPNLQTEEMSVKSSCIVCETETVSTGTVSSDGMQKTTPTQSLQPSFPLFLEGCTKH